MAYTVYYDRVGAPQGTANNRAINTYTTTHTINFDSFISDPSYVGSLPEIPKIFSSFPSDPFALLEKISPRQDEDDPQTWHVTLEYSRISADQNLATTDVLNKPPRVSWSTAEYDKPFAYDINGQIVCNSAGDLFNPPETIDDSRVIARVIYNLAFVPTWILDYRGKVNNSPFTLEGVYIDMHCCRIRSVEVSEWKVEMGTYFREVTLGLEMRDTYTVSNTSTGVGTGASTNTNVTVYGWQKVIQDAGYRKVSSSKLVKILDDNNMEVSQPALLNGKGDKLAVPITPGQEFYRVYDAIPDRDFSVLNLPP